MTLLNQKFDAEISNLFNQESDFNNKLDLRKIILLDSHSTMDLFYNQALITES